MKITKTNVETISGLTADQLKKSITDNSFNKMNFTPILKEIEKTKKVDKSEEIQDFKEECSIEQILKSKGFTVESTNNEKIPNSIIEFAHFIYNEQPLLDKILHQIRHDIAQRNSTTNFCLDGYKKEEQEIILQFLERSALYGYIRNYYYDDKKKTIRFQLIFLKHPSEFLNGKWLELYVPIRMKEIFKERNQSKNYEILRNVKIRDERNSVLNELDILLRVENKLYWIELKTGAFLEQLQKYHDLGVRLGVVPDNTFVVAANLCLQEQEEALSYNFEYHITSIDNFEKTFKEVVCNKVN